MKYFEIFIDDLKKDVRKKVLSFLGLKDAKEGNYDVFPLFILEED